MTGDKAVEPDPPQTLVEAQWALARIRPRQRAPLGEWLAYYQRSVSLYEQLAEVDPGHELEVLYWAQRERDRAREIAARIQAEGPGE